jgi:hypothetical protein
MNSASRPQTFIAAASAADDSVEVLLRRAIERHAADLACDHHTAASLLGDALTRAAAMPRPMLH